MISKAAAHGAHVMPNVKQLFNLSGKTAVITGASGGLLHTVSKYFLQAGASVALIDNNMEQLEPSVKKLTDWYNTPGNKLDGFTDQKQIISSWACDIADSQKVENTINAIRQHHDSPLNVLINGAGYNEKFYAEEYPADKFKRIIDVNLNGSMFVSQAVANTLIKDGQPGSFILVGSMSGSIINRPPLMQTGYNTSKAGVIHMAKSLASEWAKHNIRVNCLSPGYIATPMTKELMEANPTVKAEWEGQTPMSRMAEPYEFAGPLLYMASDASSFMTGHDLLVDGGFTVW